MKKNSVYIVAAIIAIALAVVLFFKFGGIDLGRQTDTPQASPSEEPVVQVPTVQIVVAIEPIEIGEEITDSMLGMKSVPVTDRPLTAFGNAYEVLGTEAVMDIEKDAIIVSAMIEQQTIYIAETQGLSYEIPEGYVGLAIPAEDLRGMAGYLMPGDVVNIMANSKVIEAAIKGIPFIDGDVVPETQDYLVKNVTIIAVGDKAYDEMMATNALEIKEAKSNATSKNSDDESPADVSYDCVIIAVDDLTARIVTETMRSSELTFALQHREAAVHDVTVPELVQVDRAFTYMTEADYNRR